MFTKIKDWLFTFLELQLLICLLSLPVLIHWGLGMSSMLIIANLLFTPILAAFLWCSCLIATCSLLHIPCLWLVKILEKLAALWHYFLAFSQPNWLIGFSDQMLIPSIVLGLCLLFFYTFFYPKKTTSLCILLFCSCLLFALRCYLQKDCFYKMNDYSLYVLRNNGKTYLIDNGALCAKRNPYSWIDFTILPDLVKTQGITTAKTLVLCKPGKNLPKAAQQLVKQTMIKNIIATQKNHCYEQIKDIFIGTDIVVHPLEPAQPSSNDLSDALKNPFYI